MSFSPHDAIKNFHASTDCDENIHPLLRKQCLDAKLHLERIVATAHLTDSEEERAKWAVATIKCANSTVNPRKLNCPDTAVIERATLQEILDNRFDSILYRPRSWLNTR